LDGDDVRQVLTQYPDNDAVEGDGGLAQPDLLYLQWILSQ
jgi:hypothetical protein